MWMLFATFTFLDLLWMPGDCLRTSLGLQTHPTVAMLSASLTQPVMALRKKRLCASVGSLVSGHNMVPHVFHCHCCSCNGPGPPPRQAALGIGCVDALSHLHLFGSALDAWRLPSDLTGFADPSYGGYVVRIADTTCDGAQEKASLC